MESPRPDEITAEAIKELYEIFSKIQGIVEILNKNTKNPVTDIMNILTKSFARELMLKANDRTIQEKNSALEKKEQFIKSLLARIRETNITSAATIEALEKQVTDLIKQLETQTTKKNRKNNSNKQTQRNFKHVIITI